MWILKLRIKHDCTIGNRCRKFRCTSYSLSLSNWHDAKFFYTSQRHTIEGKENDVKLFLNDLKKDKRIVNLEASKNTVFFIEKRKKGIPSSYYTPEMFFVKPVFVERTGYELWELASWKKDVLIDFLNHLKTEKDTIVKLEKLQNVKLDTIYFPKIMPKLSPKQKEAYQLALENGYYRFPRKIDLGKLAKIMGISLSTYQEHLRRAEMKMMPSFT